MNTFLFAACSALIARRRFVCAGPRKIHNSLIVIYIYPG
ncbi:hypothetical protein HMPREF1569_4764 [Klebsiella oxytoca OK-1]|nr:hypothetical protein HMPREF1569_4764 [Klebsiella oxytoca OK-1]